MIDLQKFIGKDESSTIEYKAVMPTSRNLARNICAFANSEGGCIFIGVKIDVEGKVNIVGLSNDFHINTITHKAVDSLSIKPKIEYGYFDYENKKIYAIQIEKSNELISLEGNFYIRDGSSTIIQNDRKNFTFKGFQKIKDLSEQLSTYLTQSTEAKRQFIEHYHKILRIMDETGNILYPLGASFITDSEEGKVMSKILFCSYVDNFETYLSNLLYEIYLSKPETLKSHQQVTVKEVLDCGDMQEFIEYIAKEKIGKLQKGSVKGFIKENKQIQSLNAIKDNEQDEIEKILQIRHLYTHRNGIVDEKFLKFFKTGFNINEEHQLSIYDMCEIIGFLIEIVEKVDVTAIKLFNLGNN